MDYNTLDANYKTGEVGGKCGSYENQCSIRMSGALRKSGFNLDSYGDPTCTDESGEIRTRGAESLANYLWKKYGPAKKFPSVDKAKINMKGKTGIVFFKDIPSFQDGRGDHIDMWDGNSTKGGYFYNSKEIWFWEMK